MALASTAYVLQALDALTASGSPVNLAAYVSLHTATTSTTGASEATGGGYARQAMTWNAASAGTKTNSGTATFTTTGSTANTHVGTFSASTSGTFGIGLVLTSSVTAVTVTVAPGALTVSAS
jgi:hypothetical protein